MLRYFAASSLIVAAVLVAILALPGRHVDGGAPAHYASGTGTPGPPVRDPFVRVPLAVTGDAPWALSALPECFKPLSAAHGSAAFARAHLPRDARRIAPGTQLRVADCTLLVENETAVVSRAENRLRIPPLTRMYFAGNRLVAERREGGRGDVRSYALRGPARIAKP